jgi:hypothetical protein
MTNRAIDYGIAVASSSRGLSRLLPTYCFLHWSGTIPIGDILYSPALILRMRHKRCDWLLMSLQSLANR